MPLNPAGSASLSSSSISSRTPMYEGDRAGGDLDGTYPSPIIRDGVIVNSKYAPGSITGDKIASHTVTSENLADISTLGIFPLTSGSQIISGLITNAHLYGLINTNKLTEGALFINNYANQVVSGVKTFYKARTPHLPVISQDLTNKYYVDTKIASGAGSSPTGAAGGDLAGTYPNPTIGRAAVSGNKVAANSLTWGQMLNSLRVLYNTNVIGIRKNLNLIAGSGISIFAQDNASGDRVDIIISGGSSGGSPTGAAGGDLAGTYPNPTIGTNVIKNSYIQSAAISGNVIGNQAIAQGHVLSGYVDLSTNQFLSGAKFFNDLPKTQRPPVIGFDLTNKAYVDQQDNISYNSLSGIQNTLSSVQTKLLSDESAISGVNNTGVNSQARLTSLEGRTTTVENNTSGINNNLITTEIKVNAIESVLSGHNHDNRYESVLVNTGLIGTSRRLNFLASSGISIFAQFNPSADWIDIIISGGSSGGGAPSGPAGGDLAGTYPNPTIGTNKIKNSYIQSAAISGNVIATPGIGEGHLKDFQGKFDAPNTNFILSGFHSYGNSIVNAKLVISGNSNGQAAGPLDVHGDDTTGFIRFMKNNAMYGNITQLPGGEIVYNGQYFTDPSYYGGTFQIGGNRIQLGVNFDINWNPSTGFYAAAPDAGLTRQDINQLKVTNGTPAYANTGLGGILVSGVTSLGDNLLSGSTVIIGSHDATTLKMIAATGQASNLIEIYNNAGFLVYDMNAGGTFEFYAGALGTINGLRKLEIFNGVSNLHVANDVKLTFDSTDNANNESPDFGLKRLSPGMGKFTAGDTESLGGITVSGIQSYGDNLLSGTTVIMASHDKAALILIPASGQTKPLQEWRVDGATARTWVTPTGTLSRGGDLTTIELEIAQRSVNLGSLGQLTWAPLDAYSVADALGNVADTGFKRHAPGVAKPTDGQTGFGRLLTSGIESLGDSTLSGNNYFQRAFGQWPELAYNLATKHYVDSALLSGSPSNPIGAAGGDLDGTYPNPTIRANGNISGNKIGTGAILNGHISLNSIANNQLRSASVSGNVIATPGISQGHVLSGYIDLFTNQSVSGVKFFNDLPKTQRPPIIGFDLTNKAYVDQQDNIAYNSISGISATEVNSQARLTVIETSGATPSGNAGGDLAGTYPNPTVRANGCISGNKIGTGAILNGHISLNSIANNQLQSASVSGNVIATPGISQGHVLNGYVDLSANQTISGTKTFFNGRTAGNPINSNDIVNKGYVDSGINVNYTGPAIYPISAYPVTADRVFSNVHVGGGPNSVHDVGLGVAGVLDRNAIWRLRFLLPQTLPAGTPKINLLALAANTSGNAIVNPKVASIPPGNSPSHSTLTALGQYTVTWGANSADKYQQSKIILSGGGLTLGGGNMLVMDLTFEQINWTLSGTSTWFPTLTWEY